MAEPWNLRRALRDAVRRAIARMRAHGHHTLADRVQADEQQRVAEGVQRIAARPWMDEFGVIHCGRCYGALNPPKGIPIRPCRGHETMRRTAA